MADGSGFLPPAAPAAPFKEAMSRWATGVAIASCRFEGAPHGLAISSFTSVSATPPRVLFCLAKTSRSALAFRHALEVGIALLPEDAEPLARRFSGGLNHTPASIPTPGTSTPARHPACVGRWRTSTAASGPGWTRARTKCS